MSQSAEFPIPAAKITEPALVLYGKDIDDNKTRSWYARKYIVLESIPGKTDQKLSYRDLSVWENIKALVGFGPTTKLTTIACYCATKNVDDAVLQPKYERYIQKRIEKLGSASSQKIAEIKGLFSKDQLTDKAKALLTQAIQVKSADAEPPPKSVMPPTSATHGIAVGVREVPPVKVVQDASARPIARAVDPEITHFISLSAPDKHEFLKRKMQSAEDCQKFIEVMSSREKLGVLIESTYKKDFDAAVLLLTDVPEDDQLNFIVSQPPDEQLEIVELATLGQLLHLLPRTAHPILQSEIINRLASSPLDEREIALSQFSVKQLRDISERIPTIELVNKFLTTIKDALLPDVRVDLFCKLPLVPQLNKLGLMRGILFSTLSQAQQQTLRPMLYAEFRAAFDAQDVVKILSVLEVLPWSSETHLGMFDIAVRNNGRKEAIEIIDMIPTQTLSQKDIAAALGNLNDLIRSTQPLHGEIANKLSQALKSQSITDKNLRENIAGIAEAAQKKGGTMAKVATTLEEWLKLN